MERLAETEVVVDILVAYAAATVPPPYSLAAPALALKLVFGFHLVDDLDRFPLIVAVSPARIVVSRDCDASSHIV